MNTIDYSKKENWCKLPPVTVKIMRSSTTTSRLMQPSASPLIWLTDRLGLYVHKT